ncbi:MAG: HAMP domain-containing sensor histidine kinase [Bacteroidota bacterium]
MRLIFKITLFYLLITLLVFVLGGIISYQVIKNEIDKEQRWFLKGRLREVSSMIERRNPQNAIKRNKFSVTPLTGDAVETKISFSDTLVMHSDLRRIEPHLRLDVTKMIAGRYYDISIYDLIIEADDIEEGVEESLIKMYILLFVAVLILSWGVSFWVLKPFNRTLELIKVFDIRKKEKLYFPHSNTKEFRQLTHFLEEMTSKVQSDYQSLKEFSENASHEMQTPLAIAKGKLELLMEKGDLKEEQLRMVDSAYSAVSKLSKLGRSLSLLTKIENKEFSNTQNINFSELVQKLLFSFKELIDLKNITLTKHIEEEVLVHIDKTLADILITNLFQNAIRHNYEAGYIKLKLTQTSFELINSAKSLSIENPEVLFTRFKKAKQSGDSIGLGLSIVKKICEINQFKIAYSIQNEEHRLKIHFFQS